MDVDRDYWSGDPCLCQGDPVMNRGWEVRLVAGKGIWATLPRKAYNCLHNIAQRQGEELTPEFAASLSERELRCELAVGVGTVNRIRWWLAERGLSLHGEPIRHQPTPRLAAPLEPWY